MDDTINLDFDRQDRLGFPEVVFGASKPVEAVALILKSYQERGENALVTKLQAQKANTLLKEFKQAFFDAVSGCFILDPSALRCFRKGEVAILSAGTSDAFVVNEAYHTLSFLGIEASRINDVGVAGIHRLMQRVDELRSYRILIVVAGFEGALPTAVGGLLAQPIIAVPSSVGYGVAEGGAVALNAMLSSCSNGVTVVNIDNGYGAAMAAFRMLRQLGDKAVSS